MIENVTLTKIGKIAIGEECGCINITEFSLSGLYSDTDRLIEFFIRSDYYLTESRLDFVRLHPWLNFLGSPFALENIYANDFKKMDSAQTQQYLFDYRDRENWRDDRESFENLVRRFYELYPDFDKQEFYVLNKDWFVGPDGLRTKPENTDPRLIFGVWWSYTFFILLIWLDHDKKTLTVTEWFYD